MNPLKSPFGTSQRILEEAIKNSLRKHLVREKPRDGKNMTSGFMNRLSKQGEPHGGIIRNEWFLFLGAHTNSIGNLDNLIKGRSLE